MSRTQQKERVRFGTKAKRAIAWALSFAMVFAAGNLPTSVVEALAAENDVPYVTIGEAATGSAIEITAPTVKENLVYNGQDQEVLSSKGTVTGSAIVASGEAITVKVISGSSITEKTVATGTSIAVKNPRIEYSFDWTNGVEDQLADEVFATKKDFSTDSPTALDAFSYYTLFYRVIAEGEDGTVYLLDRGAFDFAVAKAEIKVTPVTINSGITEGATLADVTITGQKAIISGTSTEVKGTWSWVTPSEKLKAGTNNYKAKFTADEKQTPKVDEEGNIDDFGVNFKSYEIEVSIPVTAKAAVTTGTNTNANTNADSGSAATEEDGWVKNSDGTWSYISDGEEATGWVEVGGTWYYLDEEGTMETGWVEVNGTWYYTDNSGAMQTGWQEVNGSWYYLDNSGAMETGWVNDNGTWYYTSASGAMETGWVNDNGTWYYTSGSGAMQTGWVNDNGTWYYTSGSGAMQTGWVNDNGTWYYTSTSGSMLTGWQLVNGKWYYLTASGAMKTGWLKDGSWYYLDASGAMQTGWYQVGGKWYYSYASGAMAANTRIGSYRVNANGEWVR